MDTNRDFNFGDAIAALRRRRALLIAVGGTVALGSVLLALFLPSVYRSQAIILIEQQEIPSDLVRSTVTSFADQRIQVISQRVMTSSNLFEIMEKYGLYEDLRRREPREIVLQEMRDDIQRNMISADVVDPRSGRPTEATIAFSLSYDNRSPQLAQRVANELVSLYLNENIKSRSEAAEETTSFLTNEADLLRKNVVALEQKLADFKSLNVNNRPELERVIRESLTRVELESSEAARRIASAQQQKIYLDSQLAQIEPYRTIEVSGGMSASERLRAVEAELASAEASYGVRHPDVVRLRKQAEGLRSEVDPGAARRLYEGDLVKARDTLDALLDRYEANHPDVSVARRHVETLESKIASLPIDQRAEPNNPAYISLNAQRESVDTEIATMQKRRSELQDRIEAMTQSLYTIPEVEAQYRAIEREYESASRKYQEISAKQMEARLSQNLESERKGEKFTLIEPPLLPEEPAEPNRTAILIIGVLLGLAAGFGSVGIAEGTDNKVRGRKGIQALLSAPPLASIPLVVDSSRRVSGSARAGIATAALAGTSALLLVSIHYFYKPLDVLWFVLMRKLGM